MINPPLSHTLPGYCGASYPWSDIISFFPVVDNPTLLEVGCLHGLSTAYWAELLPEWQIHSVDTFAGYDGPPFPNVIRYTGEEQFRNFKKVLDTYSNVSYTIGDFSEIVMEKPWDNPTVLFYDGDHTYYHTRNALQRYKDTPVIVVDDYTNAFKGCMRAVKEIEAYGRKLTVLPYPGNAGPETGVAILT